MTNFRIFNKASILIASTFLLMGCDQDTSSSILVEDAQTKRPNILLILADDLGYSDIGAFGGEISTPNLNALAMNGVRMSNFYAAATCSPTRTMLLSGVDNHRAGMGNMAASLTDNQKGKPGYEGYLNHDVVSVATLLKEAGYHTYMAGKWHLGLTEELSPKARGFERSFALTQGGAGHFDDTPIGPGIENSVFRENGKESELPEDFYSSAFYTDKMIEYLKTGENDDKPFFAYLTYTAPHWPLQAPQDYIDKYKGAYDDGYNALQQKRLNSMQELGLVEEGAKIYPSSFPKTANWDALSDDDKKRSAREMEIYAGMVDNMDYHIGRLLDYLDQTGQRDNTLIIFISDNGAEGGDIGGFANGMAGKWIDKTFDNSYENMGKKGSYIYYGPHWAGASTAPSRLFKAHSTEGGIKVPGIINFPGKLDHLKGKFNDEFMTVLDLAPTFLELAGTEHPGTEYQGRQVFPLNGKSAADFLTGNSSTIHGEEYTMVWELFNEIAVRNNDWKLIKIPVEQHGTGDWELFDLSNDPGETTDIKADHPEQFQKMIKTWNDYIVENGVILSE